MTPGVRRARPPREEPPVFTPINLKRWVEEHRHLLQPPVCNKQVWLDDRETIVMIVGGPNQRNDYHVNPTEEFFYQVQGDVTVRIIHPDTGKPHDITIREGEIYLLPAKVPHSPMRGPDTVGLVIELKRPAGSKDLLRWYCERDGEVVWEAPFTLQNIAVDLKQIMERFWSDPALRRCKRCGTVVEKPAATAATAAAAM